MNKKIFFGILILLTIIASAIYYSQITSNTNKPTNEIEGAVNNPPTVQNDKITVSYPKAGDTVTSPFKVEGQARGTWYFEAMFPVTLVDEFGNLLGQGQGHAEGNWMTTDFVPYSANISYDKTKIPASGRGVLILRKDNPSGDPERDEAIQVPVYLK